MRFFNLSPENQHRLAMLVPVIALTLSLFVVYPGWGQYRDLNAKVGTQLAELAALKAAPIPRLGPIAPTADDLPSEAPQFLGQISVLASAARCRIVGFEAVPPEKPKEGASTAIRPVHAHIDLESSFQQLRDFISLLAQAPRLYVVTDVKLTAEKESPTARAQGSIAPGGGLHTTLEIERYVVAPPVAPPRSG